MSGAEELSASASAASYDAVPYSFNAFRQTDPGCLAVIARVFGLDAVPPHDCRVLELGCASGGNLIPMAVSYPGSRFVGIDLSRRQIDDGVAIVKQLQLGNVELRHLSITDITPALGSFDYILVHGVYSWVPPAVQEKILEVCRDNLAANGAAFISYNTYPGWHTRRRLREMSCHHCRNISDPLERIAKTREFLVFLGEFYGSAQTAHAPLLAKEIAQLLKSPDTYLLHEYLEDYNEPLYFYEFMARASARNLQFLAEAEIASMLPAHLGKGVDQWLRANSADFLEIEQNMDFLKQRMFRQSLLCHATIALDHRLRPDAVKKFYIASALKPQSQRPEVNSEKGEAFTASGRPTVTLRAPILKAAMLCLCESWPTPLAFEALLQNAAARLIPCVADAAPFSAELAHALLNCFTAGVVEFTASPACFTTTVSERPVADPYILLRARAGHDITNLRLENITLTESSRIVLSNLDGAHDKAALAAKITDWLHKDSPEPAPGAHQERARKYIDYILSSFAQRALLIA